MPAYHYIALNQAGSELSGIIEAPDDASARAHLNNLGFSVVSLNVTNAAPPPTADASKKNAFEFEAIDTKGKKVVGTIGAEAPLAALIRLNEEYRLQVSAMWKVGASLLEKEQARRAGVSELSAEYAKLGKKQEKKTLEEETLTALGTERRELFEKVDSTLKIIEKFLTDFHAELKPDEAETVHAYLDQLMRIRDSTNLEHIRITTEKMLEHIQNHELFIHEENRIRETSRLKVETQELLIALKRTGMQQEIDIVKTATRWQEEHPFLKPFASFILKILNLNSPEIRKIRNEIKSVNTHILTYVKLLFVGKSKLIRLEAWESIKTLREEKKRLKTSLKALKIQTEQAAAQSASGAVSSSPAASIIGWVLAFYLSTYFLAYPFTMKQFGFQFKIPHGFYFYQTRLIAGITIFLFLLYGAAAARKLFFPGQKMINLLLYPLSLFAFLLFAVNLL